MGACGVENNPKTRYLCGMNRKNTDPRGGVEQKLSVRAGGVEKKVSERRKDTESNLGGCRAGVEQTSPPAARRAIPLDRILVLDGAMGTLIQAQGIETSCNDLLSIDRPEVIEAIHARYLEAGADIVSTNSFNANPISLGDYGLAGRTYELNRAAAALARRAADRYATPERPRYVAGSVGPTNRSCSISPDINRPGFRNIRFEELAEAYAQQLRGLVDGGVDLILLETFFDTLNAKAAVYALRTLLGLADFPLIVSGTVTDASGRLLSGQTIEAFYCSIEHARPLAVGLNCGFGAASLRPYIERLARIAPCAVSAHPNAGLPNLMGGYDESPEQMAQVMEGYFRAGLLNIVGGCCGTTPDHIAAIARRAAEFAPRSMEPSAQRRITRLAGLELLEITPEQNFINIGERTNVAGSARFARLVREGDYEAALQVARQQVEAGAQVIDLCMDAPMIDAGVAMVEFLQRMAAEPDIARRPVMIDSSDWRVIEAGLRATQGKAVVNSISLKEGEAGFLARARAARAYGAAVVVMLFDERGQADTYERKIEVAGRSYRLLTEDGFPPEELIFDPNVLSVSTGLPEHDDYGRAFIEACRWIKTNCPGARVSGGVSNLSFSFRGNNPVREALHAVFLYHAIRAGMDMGIVNPELLQVYTEIDPPLRELCEAVVLNLRPDASERLVAYASAHSTAERPTETAERNADTERALPLDERIVRRLVRGETEGVEREMEEAFGLCGSSVGVIDRLLMPAMGRVGELFANGQMFLPQVVKSARVMQRAVAALEPLMTAEPAAAQAACTLVIATVRGDVHDIGKNIVSVVLGCNNYRVVDLGVMTPPERIVEAAVAEGARAVLLSGLITPSLEEMRVVAEQFQAAGLRIPICVGGATTSALHTAVRLAPAYDGVVAHSGDASACVRLVNALLNDPDFETNHRRQQARLRDAYRDEQRQKSLRPLAEARKNALKLDFTRAVAPACRGQMLFREVSVGELIPLIDWSFFFTEWDMPGRWPELLDHPQKGDEARKLHGDAKRMLERLARPGAVRIEGMAAILPAASRGDDLLVGHCAGCAPITLPQLRSQAADRDENPSVADFVRPLSATGGVTDALAPFALGITLVEAFEDAYDRLLARILCDRLAEAFAEWIARQVAAAWGLDRTPLRVAFGYPMAPDHSLKRELFDLLEAERQLPSLRLTESCMIDPPSAVAGLLFGHPDAALFPMGPIGDDQWADYAARRGVPLDELRRFIASA